MIKETAKQIEDRFSEIGFNIPTSEIESRLEKLLNEFKVPAEEARRSVVNYFLKEYNIPRGDFYTQQGNTPTVKVKDINADGKWINIKAKVAQLWDNNHESIGQVGLIGDESGTIKFTKWASAELPGLEEGKSYNFKNVVTNSYQERFQINLNKSSQIEEIEEDIEIGTEMIEFIGAMVGIQAGSGLIKRCPQCNRALIKGVCGEHGKVEGTYDLRIKAVLDNGHNVQDTLLNREVSERLTNITLEEAVHMATEALEQSVVVDKMKEQLVGRYYSVTGPRLDRYILIETISPLPPLERSQIEALLSSMEV
ncbi:MAG: replication factor A [Methanosarcinales archaeon]|nr:replication factor A [Methanosarcinales archaeon]